MGGPSPSCPPADPLLSTLPGTLQPKQDGTHCPTSRGCLGPWVQAGGLECVAGAGGAACGGSPASGGCRGTQPRLHPVALPALPGCCAVPEMEASCHALPLADTARGQAGGWGPHSAPGAP